MCYPVKCQKCGKTTWAGCGKHKDMVMSKIPENERCTCPRDEKELPPKEKVQDDHSGNITEIKTIEQFNTITQGNNLVIVDFFATWCNPCKAMAPIVYYILLYNL